MMKIFGNRWFAPLLAMVLALSVSSFKVYLYLDKALNAYAQSFYVDTTDYFVYWTFHTREIQELVDGLDGKQKEMDKRQEDLDNLQTRLDDEKKELEEIKSQVEAIRNGLSDTVVQAKEGEMQNLKNLASTYAAMDASAVVGVFNDLDDNTVVKILSLMKSDTVGAIFEAMEKSPDQGTQMDERIARLSEKLRLYRHPQAVE